MLPDLVDAISIKLNESFPGVEIYSESVLQALNPPCFFIGVLNPSQDQLLGKRYFRKHPFDVHYFPAVADNKAEMYQKATELTTALELVTLLNGDVIRGTEPRWEIVDGVLHFFVSYDVFVQKITTAEEFMGEVTIEADVKG